MTDDAAPAGAGRGTIADAHALDAGTVAARLTVTPSTGLDPADARDRRRRYGANAIGAEPTPSLPAMVVDAVTEPFILLLFGAGVLAVILGEIRDGLLVLLALLPIVGAEVLTTYRSEHALEALREAAAPRARVRRSGEPVEILASDVVPGDIVLIETGDVVPADLRLVRAEHLLIDRSLLTGESIPEPAVTTPDPADASVPDRHAVAYAGTAVVGGRGEGIVVSTGVATEFGRIARRLAVTERRRSPLQRELDRLVRILLVLATGLIAFTVGIGFIRGNPVGANVLAGISAAIAAIPEEPPVLLAVVLGLGAYRLLRRGVLVRRLSAQETLGAVDLIITDKTGTLTENRLALRAVLTPDGEVSDDDRRRELVGLAVRAEEDAWQVAAGGRPGSFTRALLETGDDGAGPVPIPDPRDLVDARGPGAEHPYSTTRSRLDGTEVELVVGAPEVVLGLPLADDDDAGRWRSLVETTARTGERLLLLARGAGDGGDGARTWRPQAVLAFADPLRSGVPEALRLATDAGIQTLVVTGDHAATAATIARSAGLDPDEVVVGRDLADWSDETLRERLPHLSVVARAVPEDKLRLVDQARLAGRTVAVTGDGVNDAPALQHADVAVAMGSGTAVARDASDLVLGDDSFATLMYGLREGRRIVANVQKGLVFLISTHIALLGYILIATIAGHSQPLLPIQILWLELFIDLSTSIAFEREPEEPEAMSRPPRDRDRPLLDAPLLVRIAIAGGFSAVAALVLVETQPGTDDHVRWLAFSALVAAQVVRAYANRSLSRPVLGLRPNGLLVLAIAIVLAIQVLIPLVPPLAEAFRASPLDLREWGLVALVALAPAVLAEVIRRTTGRTWVA